MINHHSTSSAPRTLARTLLAAAGLALACQSALAGTWTKVVNNPPHGVNHIFLLSDGTVMACGNDGTSTISKAWYKLTPSATGSYVNGTWSTLAVMHDTRLYFQTQVLMDGRVYCSGGEYGTGGPKAEVYDPTTNVWTQLTIPAALWNPASDDFYDCNSEITPDGKVLLSPVFPHTSGATMLYNPATNTWSAGGKLFRGQWQDEASWVKLPDNSILTIDPFGTLTERYIPATNTWINDGVVPVALYDPFGSELGGATYLPNGKAIFLGSTGHNALYTPTGTNAPGTWVAAPDFPNAKGTPDAPSAMMVDGKLLCAVSAIPTSANHFPSPTSFFEYDYVTNSFATVNGPTGATDPISCYQAAMLCLPNGQILYTHMSNSVYVYTPTGAPIAAGKPTITSITSNGDGSFHMVGVKLNGISEGATYGDDFQMNTNYPVVRISHSNGNTYYARSYNWTSTGIAVAGPVATEYRPPAGMPAGAYTLVVTANGFASDPATGPVITDQPDDAQVCRTGNTASFHVAGSGTPNFSYQWRRGTTVLSNAGHFSGVTTATLVVSSVDATVTGNNYNCIVTNALGSATSANASLSICLADFDCSGFVDLDDYDAFVHAFEVGGDDADFDGSGFVDLDDFDAFVHAFEIGC